jgi:hypothetical protein
MRGAGRLRGWNVHARGPRTWYECGWEMYLSSECVGAAAASSVKRQASGVKQASNKDRDRTGMEWTWSGHGADMEGTVEWTWSGQAVE